MIEQRLSVKGARYALLGFIAVIFAFAWNWNLGQGTDDRARQLIGEIAPSFRAWVSPVWTPSSKLELMLFLVQGLIGIGLFSYVCIHTPFEQES